MDVGNAKVPKLLLEEVQSCQAVQFGLSLPHCQHKGPVPFLLIDDRSRHWWLTNQRQNICPQQLLGIGMT